MPAYFRSPLPLISPVTFLLPTMPVVRLRSCRSVLAPTPSAAHATPPKGDPRLGGVTPLCDRRLYTPVVTKSMSRRPLRHFANWDRNTRELSIKWLRRNMHGCPGQCWQDVAMFPASCLLSCYFLVVVVRKLWICLCAKDDGTSWKQSNECRDGRFGTSSPCRHTGP